MGSNGNGGFGFELNTGISTPRSNFPFCSSFLVPYCESSSGIATGSGASCLKTGPVYPPEMVEPFSACWDSLVSTDGNDSSGGELSSKGHQEKLYQLNQRGEINLAGYHSSVSLAESASSFPCLLNSRYPDNMTNYILLDSTTNSTVSPSDHQLSDTNQGIHIDECTTNTNGKIVVSAAKELEGVDGNIADREEEGRVLSPLLLDTRKRKRMPDGFTSHLTPNIDHAQRNESDQPRDSSHFSNDSMKTKKEEIVGGGDHGKLKARGENRDQNLNAEDQKEYIHVRARRGQATNSHSLAERVRREKISERMRFLQDLVPGCSKVTGKAVMLDEIINYVQSLQHQVEFLSMKLATVIPDFDVRDIVLKNIFSSEGERRSSGVMGFMPNINPSCHTINGYPLESIERGAEELQNIKNLSNTLRNTNPQFVQMEQVPNTWDNELQNVIQMHFVPQSSIGVPPKNGSLGVDN